MKLLRTHIGRIGKLVTLVTCVGLIGVVGIVIIPAVSFGASNSFGSFGSATYPKIQGCPVNKRFEHWDTFIKEGVSFSDYYENWADIFSRNSCQQLDIISLQKAIEGSQNQLRQKVFQCATDGLTELSNKIHTLQFELEYVRHVIDTDDERPAPEGTKGEVRPPAAIMQRMSQIPMLKNGTITNEQFDALFATTQKKYAARVEKYQNCKDTDWAALTQQWNNFTASWAGVKPAAQQSAKNLSGRVKGLLNIPTDYSGRYLFGLLDIKMNGLTPEQNFAGVYNDLTRDVRTIDPKNPSDRGVKKNPPDYGTFLDRVESEHGRYAKDAEDAKRTSYYEGLYRYTSDASGEEIKRELTKMNGIIQATIQPIIGNVRACTALIAARQCGGR